MAAIPGVKFNITGSSGSQAALVPKQSWRAYVFPRGAYASQDSTGTVITFDSADIAGRFAALDWIQVGTATGNIRQVSAVGGNSIAVSGSAVTVSENNRVFLIGTTQPTTSGGSTTYLVPRTTIYNRDDDGSDRFTNSMVTSDSDGLVSFYGAHGLYDCLIQDGNQSNQGYIPDLNVGLAEAVSTSFASVFGATVTFNGAIGVTGNARFSGGVSFTSTVDYTGTATFNGPTHFTRANPNNLAIGVTGLAEFNTNITVGSSATFHGAVGITGSLTGTTATFTRLFTGASASFSNATSFGFTATFTDRVSITGVTTELRIGRIRANQGTQLGVSYFVLGASWGTGATITLPLTCTDTCGTFRVSSGSAALGNNPSVTMTFANGTFTTQPVIICTPNTADTDDQPNLQWAVSGNAVQAIFMLQGTPVAGQTFDLNYFVIGRT